MKTQSIGTTGLKYRTTKLLIALAVAAAVFIPFTAQARTPDGQTPAQEGVCDPLKADGVTKGLYGLCVAFCEAQDFASVDMPLTDEEIAAFEESGPSKNLLENYNRKKKETDPSMPCIVKKAGAACPCWSEQEMDSIDGINNEQPSTKLSFNCSAQSTSRFNQATAFESKSNSQRDALAYGMARKIMMSTGREYRTCSYNDKYNGTNTLRFSTTLSDDEFEACFGSIQKKCP